MVWRLDFQTPRGYWTEQVARIASRFAVVKMISPSSLRWLLSMNWVYLKISSYDHASSRYSSFHAWCTAWAKICNCVYILTIDYLFIVLVYTRHANFPLSYIASGTRSTYVHVRKIKINDQWSTWNHVQIYRYEMCMYCDLYEQSCDSRGALIC